MPFVTKWTDLSIVGVGAVLITPVFLSAAGYLPGGAILWALGMSAMGLWTLNGTRFIVEKWSDNISLGIQVRKLNTALYVLAPLLVATSLVAETSTIV